MVDNSSPSTADRDVIVDARGLAKTFRIGFLMRRVIAVRDATFDVRRGEIFGIVGPNGAGKTTTIKMLMGLIRPQSGHATIHGVPVTDVRARRHVAFLPETPHFYDYLKPAELLDYFGDLYGLDASTKRRRIPELLDRVGLANAVDKPLRKFSKGMLQRIGLAQALLPECDLLVLDEPQSGLDPMGRKDVRDLIVEEHARGRTIIMCSHILPDVEQICDRVAIIIHGSVTRVGRLSELVEDRSTVEITATVPAVALDGLRMSGLDIRANADGTWRVVTADPARVSPTLSEILAHGGNVLSVVPHRRSLEDVFHDEARASTDTRQHG